MENLVKVVKTIKKIKGNFKPSAAELDLDCGHG